MFLGDGTGGFAPAVPFVGADGASSGAVLDLNGDGRPDVVSANGAGGVQVLLNDTAPCYCRGTRILTSSGEVSVETLRVGDIVRTRLSSGGLQAVRWLGHRRLKLTGHPAPEEACPVRIRRGTFGEGKPSRDLLVSPGHRLLLDDTLIRAVDLVNGATVVQERPATVEYWHVELDTHGIIVADGVEAESYQDTGNRAGFENGVVTALHPVLDGVGAHPCLPYGMPSATLRESMASRAKAIGWSRTREPDPWLEVNGTRIEPARRGNRYRFALPADCVEARLRSRAGAPYQTDAASEDTRRLGLALVRMTLVGPPGALEVPLDHPLLDKGFSHVEHDKGWTWRWTDGDAILPVRELSADAGVTVLEVTLDRQELMFWVSPTVADDAASRLSA